jgi:hypothetical protein
METWKGEKKAIKKKEKRIKLAFLKKYFMLHVSTNK